MADFKDLRLFVNGVEVPEDGHETAGPIVIPGPWRVATRQGDDILGPSATVFRINGERGEAIAMCTGEHAKDSADHVAACLNACAGFQDPGAMRTERADAIACLFEVATSMVATCEHCHTSGSCNEHPWMARAHKTIKRAEHIL